jgi:hypothetical protein
VFNGVSGGCQTKWKSLAEPISINVSSCSYSCLIKVHKNAQREETWLIKDNKYFIAHRTTWASTATVVDRIPYMVPKKEIYIGLTFKDCGGQATETSQSIM